MTSKLYVTEYQGLGPSPNSRAQIPLEPPIITQVVDYSGGAAASNAFDARTTLIRLHTDSVCSFVFGTSPTATTTSARMSAGQTEYHGVQAGASMKVSAIINT